MTLCSVNDFIGRASDRGGEMTTFVRLNPVYFFNLKLGGYDCKVYSRFWKKGRRQIVALAASSAPMPIHRIFTAARVTHYVRQTWHMQHSEADSPPGYLQHLQVISNPSQTISVRTRIDDPVSQLEYSLQIIYLGLRTTIC